MKKLLYVLFFVSAFGFSQIPDIGGDAVYSPSQLDSVTQRYLDNWSIGRNNEIGETVTSATNFYNDVVVNDVGDRGRWDNFHTPNSRIPSWGPDGLYEHHYNRANSYAGGTYPNEANVSENLYKTANYAIILANAKDMLDNGRTSGFTNVNGFGEITFNGSQWQLDALATALGLAVLDELIWYANAPELDATNGVRFNLSQSGAIQIGAPWWVNMAGMSKKVHAYGKIYDIVKNETIYLNNKDDINSWFKGWGDFAYINMERFYREQISQNWRNFGNDWNVDNGYTSPNSDNHQIHAYFTNSDGTGGQYLNYQNGINVWNNRELDHLEFIHTYATYFGDTVKMDWAYDSFRGFLQVYQTSERTTSEFHRGGDGVPTMQYSHIIIVQMVAMANTHAVAAIKNFPNVTEPRKYHDYSTTEGIEDRTGATIAQPNDMAKSLEVHVNGILDWWQTSAFGGVWKTYYDEAGNLVPEASEPNGDNQTNTIAAGLANAYYDDPDMNAANIRDASRGFNAYQLHGAGGLNGEWGQAWWLAGSLGGEVAAYEMGGVLAYDITAWESGGNTTPPTPPTPASANTLFQSRRRN